MSIIKGLGLAGALVAAALVGGTLINAATATEGEGEADSTAAGAYCDVFMDTLASDLGVTRESLVAAGQAAANAALDAAVEAGDVPEAAAERIRERIAEFDGEACGWFGPRFKAGFGHGIHRGLVRGLAGADVLDDAADALGMDVTELLSAARDAGSLQAVAEEQGVSYDDVTAAVLASLETELDEAIENGMPQERADTIRERVSTWLDDGGELGAHGWQFGPHPRGTGRDDGNGGNAVEDAGA